jgi:hypothetical protein
MSVNATDHAVPNGEGTLDPPTAAARLDVTVEVLHGWSEQLGFPTALGDPPIIRYRTSEIAALRAALPTAHSVEGAVQAAQRMLGR